MFSVISFEGRLNYDVEIKQTVNGNDFCFVKLVFNKDYKDKQGNWVKNPVFIPCVTYNEYAIAKLKTASKGDKLLVDCTFESRKNDKTGFDEVMFNIQKIHNVTPPKGDRVASDNAAQTTGAASSNKTVEDSEFDAPF